MEQIFEYLIPVFVVLYFVISTVYAVLKRLSTPDLPWPAEPEEPGGAPRREPPFEERPEAAGWPPARGRPAAPVPPVPVPEPRLPWPPVSGEPVRRPPVPQPPALEGRVLPSRGQPEAAEGEGAGAGAVAARFSAGPPPAPKPRAAAGGPARLERLRRRLQGGGLRDAVLLAEVIGPPRALRPYTPPPLEKR